MNITKLELCSRISKRSGGKYCTSELKPIVEEFLDEILTAMSEGNRIEIRGFGCFKPMVHRKRLGRNPRTGEVVGIPEYIAPWFKFSRDAQKIFDEKSSKIKATIPSGQIMTAAD